MSFKVTVVIECDEKQEICQHLDKLKKDIQSEIKRFPDKFDQNTETLVFDSNNCYGEHRCSVEILD